MIAPNCHRLSPFKYNIPFSLDSEERTLHHRELLKSKVFLRRLYSEWYQIFQRSLVDLPNERTLELGSGGGFLKEIIPNVLTSDIIELSYTDMTFSALDMPFDDDSLGAIFMIDTFHHIPDARIFLQEAQRTIAVEGKLVMIEPANSWWGRFIYQRFHHEPFDPSGDWSFPTSGPLSGANGALPWIVFERDRSGFEKEFPRLSIESLNYHTPFRYLISGGFSYPSLMPAFTFPFWTHVDKLLARINKNCSMFVTIVLKKT